jgi:hypothetical protein
MTTKSEAPAPKRTPQEFAEAIGRLCQEYGYDMVPQLTWKQQIDGTFTIGVQLAVVERKTQGL